MSIATYWLLIGLLLVILEIAVPGLFVFLFFGIGAFVVAGLVHFLEIDFTLQAIVFFAGSVLSMLVFRTYLKEKFFQQRASKEDPLLEDFVGKQVTALTDFKSGIGKVTFNGSPWKAKTKGFNVKQGDLLKITNKENITLIVEP